MLYLREDLALVNEVVDLLGLDDAGLFEGLHAEDFEIFLPADEPDLAKGAGANQRLDSIVGCLDRFLVFLVQTFHINVIENRNNQILTSRHPIIIPI